MGWFDNDNKEKVQAPQEPARPAVPSTAASPPPPVRASATGSTVGQRMRITGTIVSDEDLEIVGRVEGEIHARETLAIAKDAEVKAVVRGRRVVVEGALQGDVHATELVVLGATSAVQGDIHTPSLEIREGALFRGSVKMTSAKKQEPVAAAPRESSKSSGAKDAPAPKAGLAGNKPSAEDGQQKLPATSSAGS